MKSEKIDAALKKLTEEAAALSDGNPCKILISEYLMEKITSDRIAALVLAEDKNLEALNGKMWVRAREVKSGQGAHVPDIDLMRMADEYYGLTGPDSADNTVIDIATITDMLL
jgi:hypothetical protein